MCEWGTDVAVRVTVPASLSHTGHDRSAIKGIDACIADIVDALNKGGIQTVTSCCGHGRAEGHIVLRDGRTLRIAAREAGAL
jgi:hypothetical protein